MFYLTFFLRKLSGKVFRFCFVWLHFFKTLNMSHENIYIYFFFPENYTQRESLSNSSQNIVPLSESWKHKKCIFFGSIFPEKRISGTALKPYLKALILKPYIEAFKHTRGVNGRLCAVCSNYETNYTGTCTFQVSLKLYPDCSVNPYFS